MFIIQLKKIPTIPSFAKGDTMDTYIEQAKIMPKGQITIPQEIRKLLGVDTGDRVSFIVNGSQVVIANSAVCALRLLQNEMKGEAEKAGLTNENDVQAFLDNNK